MAQQCRGKYNKKKKKKTFRKKGIKPKGENSTTPQYNVYLGVRFSALCASLLHSVGVFPLF
jgi:hypothetical protein